jgi:flagellar motor component MotA
MEGYMNADEFAKEYTETFEWLLFLAEKARREGILTLEGYIDADNQIAKKGFLKSGLRLIIDGTDCYYVDKYLSNITNRDTDPDKRLLNTIIKEAVLGIQDGMNPRLLALLLNSYVKIGVERAMEKYFE